MSLNWYKVSIFLSVLGLIKEPFANEWTQKRAISNVCFTQSARFNNWQMNILVNWNAFTIWSLFQKDVNGKLNEF